MRSHALCEIMPSYFIWVLVLTKGIKENISQDQIRRWADKKCFDTACWNEQILKGLKLIQNSIAF